MSAYLTSGLALACDSDVSDIPYVAIAWDAASSNVPDWEEKVYVGRVKGSVQIDSAPARRDIVVLSAPAILSGHAVLQSGLPAADGTFNLSWPTYTGPVLVMMLDDLGVAWQANTAYAQGDLIYPPTWNGWQYQCVNPGTSSNIEPSWWSGEGQTAFIGTATFVARQYLAAQAHGPLTPLVETS